MLVIVSDNAELRAVAEEKAARFHRVAAALDAGQRAA
jgi:hypothetical protein